MSERLLEAVRVVLEQAEFDRSVKGFVIDEALYLDLRQAFEDLELRSALSLDELPNARK